jgi:orotate phosphoribosyltransferase
MHQYQRDFIDLALARQALRFGTFTLKSGRISPYFFNAGLLNDGASLARLGRCYAAALAQVDFAYDMLFGPAYKGIPLVAATAVALVEHHGRNLPWAFNRKEAKDHGEAGVLVGSAVKGKVVIVDDVITAGTAVRESVDLIQKAGAEPSAILLAFDRQERGQGGRSAIQEVGEQFGLKCVSILTFSELITALQSDDRKSAHINREQLEAMRIYRQQYGIAP